MPKETVCPVSSDSRGRAKKIAAKGHFVVYVGSEMKQFVVPTSLLKNALFRRLLNRVADEYGFDGRSRITLPCDEAAFQALVATLAN